jgi:hypothetical protein
VKITGDLKCLSCGRTWATAQDDLTVPLAKSALRTAHREFVPVAGERLRRCPRCHGTLLLEMTEAEEYETELLAGP